ncbi:MAG: hypothetical protein GEU92_18250 [Alphaproteobacteria bacterium]|nr:hypothetical protein [Alphaproteobacteria bacterium]
MVHHAGKDDARGARGHSSLRAATDTEISIKRAESGEFSIASIDKQRDGASGDKLPFELKEVQLGTDQDGDQITTAVVAHRDQSNAYSGPKLTSRQQAAKTVLFQHWMTGSPDPEGITFEQFRDLMVDRGIEEEDHPRFRQRLSELRAGLNSKGIIQVIGGRVRLVMAA